jgi:hypothetical protein
MKLADRTVEIHSNGISNKNQFSIAQTSKMFKILSDSLYSDKVMAVIRELSTNAHDAHVASKNQNSFKVTLPTQANPNFVVRDYGTGLSQEDMEELYTTYGASNKNDSNDFVGCLGLGSKSPFAYTKSFNTTSYFNGKAYSYIAAMDENGVPSLNLFGISDTNEPNGLEISFAVKQHDFTEFTNKAKRVYHYFKSRPIIEGGVCPTLNDDSYSHYNVVIEGEGWKIGRIAPNNDKYPSSYNNPGSGIIAIMGNIAYPVDSNKIIGEDKPDQPDHIQAWNRAFGKADVANWKHLVREILGAGLYLEIQFGIGELEMDVSREGLQYTKQVIKTLKQKTQDIYLSLKQDMTDKLTEAKSLVEAYQIYYNLSDLSGGWTAGASWVDPSGKTYELESGKDLEYKFKKNKHFYAVNFRTAGYRSRRMIYLTDKIHHETLNGKGQYYWSNSIRKSGKMVFFRCDISGAETAKKIAIRYCNTNDCYGYLMIDDEHPEDSTEGFDGIISDIGGEENILNISDYKDILKTGQRNSSSSRGSIGSVSNDSIFLIRGSVKSASTISGDNIMNDAGYLKEINDQEERDGILEEDTIIYIPILRYASIKGYPSIESIVRAESEPDFAKELFGSENIYAIKQSYAEKLIKEGYNLVSFNEYFKNRLDDLYKSKFSKLSVYNGLIEYAKTEYSKHEPSENYYHRHGVEKTLLWHVLNIFGLEYTDYIKNDKLVDLIDQTMILEFFAETIHYSQFNIERFKSTDYFAHMTKILAKIGITGINSSEIRLNNVTYNNTIRLVNSMYPDDSMVLKAIKPDGSLKKQMPKIEDMRKEIKDCLDSQPMLKYIVCSNNGKNNLRELGKQAVHNPLTCISTDYYSRKGWYTTLPNVDKFKTDVSASIQ